LRSGESGVRDARHECASPCTRSRPAIFSSLPRPTSLLSGAWSLLWMQTRKLYSAQPGEHCLPHQHQSSKQQHRLRHCEELPLELTRAKREGESVHQESAGHLLELAKADQLTFRSLASAPVFEATAPTPALRRTSSRSDFWSASIVATRLASKTGADAADNAPQAAPSIALRMDF
jgi:hypothetical protein